MELVNHQLNKNEWYVQHARLILQERGPNKKVHNALKDILNKNPDITRKLRALWALHVTQGLKEDELIKLLDHDNEYIRSWAIQLLAEDKNPSDLALARFTGLAKTGNSALVRLYLASAIQRTSPEKRWETLEALVQHAEDKDDQNLPLMLWYALEPAIPTDLNRASDLALKSKVPHILPFTIQRIGAIKSADSEKALKNLQQRISKMDHSPENHVVLNLIQKTLDEK
jgi:hypothetical protein